MPRGGERAGKPGGTYPQREDLQTGPRTAKGQRPAQQGEGRKKAVQQVPEMPAPGQLTALTAPTERPDEPITAGLPIGPGEGPQPGTFAPADDSLWELRALAAKYPSKDLLRLIALAESRL